MANEQKSIYSIYGAHSFLNITSALSIGKVKFDFVQIGSEGKQHISCYIDALEMAVLMRDVENGTIGQRLVKSKQSGKDYPDPVYESPLGGAEKDGKCVSRHFTIAPGSKIEVVFQGIQQAATKNDKGAFIPVKGDKPERYVVGCTYRDLRKIAIVWSYIEKEFMAKEYSADKIAWKGQSETPAPIGKTEKLTGVFLAKVPVRERKNYPGAYATQSSLNGEGMYNVVITKNCAEANPDTIKLLTDGAMKEFNAEYYMGSEGGTTVLYVTSFMA